MSPARHAVWLTARRVSAGTSHRTWAARQVKRRMWMFSRSPIRANQMISEVPP